MTWTCAAIDHGVAVFPDGRVGPCCQISADYLKPIEVLRTPEPFADLKTPSAPPACNQCSRAEYQGQSSYRQHFNSTVTNSSGLQFVDLRNTNLCNLKCRYCGPHFSSRWDAELNDATAPKEYSIDDYQDLLFTDSLHWMYFTGGEPLINPEHWRLLQHLVDSQHASRIKLVYNTNLTTVRYKDLDIIALWSQFKSVHVNVSIDAVDESLDSIRSGSDHTKILANLDKLLQHRDLITVVLTPVLSILNIWRVRALFEYANDRAVTVHPMILTGPDYLALDAIPDKLKASALACLDSLQSLIDPAQYQQMYRMINENINRDLFLHTVAHTLLLDQLRGEKLFEIEPWGPVVADTILRNHEYE